MAKMLLVVCQGIEKIEDEQGPASIASYLIKHGHKVRIRMIKKNTLLHIDDDFIPDAVGISVYHDDLYMAFEIARFYKRTMGNKVYTIMGGYSATYYYDSILNECKEIDFIIRGEGEVSTNEFCDYIDRKGAVKKTRNLIYRNPDGILTINDTADPIMDLDTLDFTSKEILVPNGIKMAHLSTTRGCFGNCSFCYSHKYFDSSGKVRWRGKSPEIVVKEMVDLSSKYEICRVTFDDASFEDSSDGLMRMEKIADLLIKEKIPMTFDVFFRASIYRRISEKLLEKLKLAGLCSVFIGVESYNDKELKIFNKNVSVHDNEKVVEYFRKNDISVAIGFINFTPYSDISTLRENADCLFKHRLFNTYLITNKIRAYKGTDLYERIKKNNLLVDDGLDYFCYKYEKQEIEVFERYLTEKFEQLNANAEYAIQSLDWYSFVSYNNYISHYKNIFQKLGCDFGKQINLWEESYTALIKEYSNTCYDWYSGLLTLLESGWDMTKANTLTDQNQLLEKSKKLYDSLNKLLINFHYKVIRSDRTLSKYFVASDVK